MDFILLPLSHLLVRVCCTNRVWQPSALSWLGKGSDAPLLLLRGFFLNRGLGFSARACPPYLSLKSFWQRDQCRVLQAQMEEFITGSETSTTTVSASSPPLFCCDTVWSCEFLKVTHHLLLVVFGCENALLKHSSDELLSHCSCFSCIGRQCQLDSN